MPIAQTVTERVPGNDVVSRFDTAVNAYADVIALQLADDTVTYRELGRRVAAVAARLTDAGDRVGVCVGKSLAGPVAYMAVLVSGRSAVPMSPQAPAGRLAAMMTAAGVRTVVTDGSPADEVVTGWTAAGIEVVDASETAAGKGGRRSVGDEAYVLFTSGSTGVPKGVRIPHAALTAYLDHVIECSGLGPGCRLTNNFELTFDPSVFDLLACLTSGATLVIPTERDEARPVEYVTGRGITHWYSVPSVVSIARQMRSLPAGAMPALVRSSFIGEPLTLDQARAWAAAAPNSVIENVYGPTELTVSCTEYVLPADPGAWPATDNGTVPIGTPYPHLDWCLVDGLKVSPGEGELCMRGSQRLISYLDPRDDAGRFFVIDDDLARDYDGPSPVPAECWYRTGDRVRVENGLMLHLGRLDRQVKVRGFRIELGEVEQHVRAVPGVLDAAAVTAEGRLGGFIVAFYTGAEQPPYELRAHLSHTMPYYMVPEQFVHLADLPRNDRGKTDYRSLGTLI